MNFSYGNMLGMQAQPQQSQQPELQNCEERIRKAYEQALAQMRQSEACLSYCGQLEVKISQQQKHVLEQIQYLTGYVAYAYISAEYNKIMLQRYYQHTTPEKVLLQRCEELYTFPTPIIVAEVLKKCWVIVDRLSKLLQ